MDSEDLKKILASVKDGSLSVPGALNTIKHLPYEDMGFARIDHHRHLRSGIPEVVFAEGKTPSDAASIAKAIYGKSGRLLMTRASEEVFKKLKIKGAMFHPASGTITAGGAKKKTGRVLVLSAGTSDIPVSEEAAITAVFLGSDVLSVNDVGVAGLHRLMAHKTEFETANAIIVVAGMEGALPSVVGGMTDKPLIAVPTSVGYGTSLGGLTALFAMLNSCVPGIAVMNIDNGFGAGCLAHRINMLACR